MRDHRCVMVRQENREILGQWEATPSLITGWWIHIGSHNWRWGLWKFVLWFIMSKYLGYLPILYLTLITIILIIKTGAAAFKNQGLIFENKRWQMNDVI